MSNLFGRLDFLLVAAGAVVGHSALGISGEGVSGAAGSGPVVAADGRAISCRLR